ncbi:MAG: DUF4197 domain-containing protein [Saprospiraceae bacterium]|nr:DUF4197 domain-containing protein [Saprospiraceae bacterium]
MKHILLTFIVLITLTFNAQSQVKDLFNKAKQAVTKDDSGETGLGLKEALNVGVESAVNQLSAQNGYLESPYKILIPEDAQKVIDKVKKVPGFQDVEQKLINQMNEAAEIAAKKATPIFVNAIKQMTFRDATKILTGPENAATNYLSSTSRLALYDTFMPIIQSSLDEVNARTYWTTVVQAYNAIPFVRKMNPELDDHVNNRALDGLFGLIAVKEKGIRTDVSQRTSPLLQKVFGN